MDSQVKRILSFAEVFNFLLGKEVYICCLEGQMVFRGILERFDFNKLILNTKNEEIPILPSNIAGINVVNSFDEIAHIEENMISDTDSQFYHFLNKYVICLTKVAHWGHCGILTYIGSNYITIFNQEDMEFSRVPISEIQDMATSFFELKL